MKLFYETAGDPEQPPLLLVAGLGAQLVAWPDELCERLARAGLFVIRFDNRDAGLSPAGSDAGYSITEMAVDVVGLMDHLGISAAHVAGQSLGGVIAQRLALDNPAHVALATALATPDYPADAGFEEPSRRS